MFDITAGLYAPMWSELGLKDSILGELDSWGSITAEKFLRLMSLEKSRKKKHHLLYITVFLLWCCLTICIAWGKIALVENCLKSDKYPHSFP